MDFLSQKYGFDLLNILIGKSHMSLRIDRETGQFIDSFYEHVDTVKKHNGSDIDANFFIKKENQHISAIIFSDVNMCEKYDLNNTFMFLNPYAINKIKVKDFKNMIYWRANKNMEYIPRYRGKNLWKNLNRKFF